MTEIRFRDSDGWQWKVVEHSSRRKAAVEESTSRPRSLYFLSRYETRRCDDFPTDWAKRPPKELIRLCEVAEPL
jgi:hypothetical protein